VRGSSSDVGAYRDTPFLSLSLRAKRSNLTPVTLSLSKGLTCILTDTNRNARRPPVILSLSKDLRFLLHDFTEEEW